MVPSKDFHTLVGEIADIGKSHHALQILNNAAFNRDLTGKSIAEKIV